MRAKWARSIFGFMKRNRLYLLPAALFATIGVFALTQQSWFANTFGTLQHLAVINPVVAYYEANRGDTARSISTGTTANGTLINGKLVPFNGSNFEYFDTSSYLGGRAFLNDRVLKTFEEVYDTLAARHPGRKFRLMECSLRNGGPIPGHRTHQNGLSTDVMVPVTKNGEPYYGLDSLGGWHYALDFNNNGQLISDTTVTIDFELLAEHVFLLNKIGKKHKLKVAKTILKLELKDELYATVYGKKIKNAGIYFAMNLPDFINRNHDDHYHIDFEVLP